MEVGQFPQLIHRVGQRRSRSWTRRSGAGGCEGIQDGLPGRLPAEVTAADPARRDERQPIS